jgi:hypothetical protein
MRRFGILPDSYNFVINNGDNALMFKWKNDTFKVYLDYDNMSYKLMKRNKAGNFSGKEQYHLYEEFECEEDGVYEIMNFLTDK